MNLPLFYEQQLNAATSELFLSEETAKHCVQVLRMKKEDALQLTNGEGLLITAAIKDADKKHCSVIIHEQISLPKPQRKISVAISLLKNTNRFEWFLEKATEIGVSEIIPLLCRRTERQHFRHERMKSILISAMLQSQRVWLPVLQQPISFENAIHQCAYQQKLIAHCLPGERKELNNLIIKKSVQFFIGPEGDFTEEEIQLALQNNFEGISLGANRLRTETAGIVAAVLLNANAAI